MEQSKEKREKVSLTAARVLALACAGKSQTIHWDSKSPGFGLRVTKGGARAFVFESRLFGKSLRVTIGDALAWELGKARTEAARLKMLIDNGVDPRQVRAEQRAAIERAQSDAQEARAAQARAQEAEAREAVTFGEAWDKYVVARTPHWSDRHLHDHHQHAQAGGKQRGRRKEGVLTKPGPLASLRQLRLVDLSGEKIAEWLSQESKLRPTMTALSFRLLRGFIRWAHDVPEYVGLIPEHAYRKRVVTDSVPRVRPKEGDVLQREQLSAWFKSVRDLENVVASVYLQGLLITGARREELAGLRWQDVDLVWRSLKLDDKVEGSGGRTIPLPPYLAEQLLSLRPLRRSPLLEGQVDWVFVANSADGNISEPRSAHARALNKAGLPHISLHGLRRSFGTLAEWCEVPVGIVAQIQGHKPSAIAEKHYRRRSIDLLRMWHDKIESWMLEQAGLPHARPATSSAGRAVDLPEQSSREQYVRPQEAVEPGVVTG
jgi:integrase